MVGRFCVRLFDCCFKFNLIAVTISYIELKVNIKEKNAMKFKISSIFFGARVDSRITLTILWKQQKYLSGKLILQKAPAFYAGAFCIFLFKGN